MKIYRPTYRDKTTGEQRQGSVWWVYARVMGRTVRKSTGCRSKKAARDRGQELVTKAERRAIGAPVEGDVFREPIAPHLKDFLGSLAAKERNPQHQREVRNGVEDFIRWSEATHLDELDDLRAERWLAELRAGGISARTYNRLRGYLKQLGSWLERKGRVQSSPFKALEALSVESDRRLERRALTPTELNRLLEVAPEERARVYLLACDAGLRRGEIAKLTWANLDLEARTVKVRASTSKNKRTALLVLSRRATEALRSLEGGNPGDLVFGKRGVPPVSPGKGCELKGSGCLREDLQAAGIDYVNGVGTVDFHALRGTFATMLANAGVPLPQVQALMRHSSPSLTARYYIRHTVEDSRAAIEALEGCLPGAVTTRGDGGDDEVSESSPLKPAPLLGGDGGDDGDGCFRSLVLEKRGEEEERAAGPQPTLQRALQTPGDARRRDTTYAEGIGEPSTKSKARESYDSRASEPKATPGFEPGNNGFAIRCLTTWPCRHLRGFPR